MGKDNFVPSSGTDNGAMITNANLSLRGGKREPGLEVVQI